MPSKEPPLDALSYFMHEVDGRLYGAWFRRQSNSRRSDRARAAKSAPRAGFSAERAAAIVLEEIIRMEDRKRTVSKWR
jgi:hypothetical protein